MSQLSESRRKASRARERRERRQQRRQTMKTLQEESASRIGTVAQPPPALKTAATIAQDVLWHLRNRRSLLLLGGGVLVLLVVLWVLGTLLSGNIGPNVTVLGMNLGGLSVDDAASRLTSAFEQDVRVQIMLDGEVLDTVAPADIGIALDAERTAEAAKSVGLAGFPFGYGIEPMLESDYGTAQDYMLSIVDMVYIPPYEAGYEWRDGQLVSVRGRSSRELDIALSVQRIVDNPLSVIVNRRVDLLTTSSPPRVVEADSFFDEAYAFVTSNFTIEGYDPFLDEHHDWRTTREEMARWLVVEENRLSIREEGLQSFIDSVNDLLRNSERPRYLDEDEAREAIVAALQSGDSSTMVRIRYLPGQYTVEEGVYGYEIGRRTGLPFGQIDNVNPSIDWNVLSVGQLVNLPSRDIVMPLPPVPNKRIVVDLDRLWLVAFEDEEVVMHWTVSSGRSDAPTFPGVYQILSKDGLAYGSSFDLCNADGNCGQWEMEHFMSIYEVGPGLMNGFHGAVRLPNGGYLDGGSQQVRSTYGCVMSDNHQAEQLYNWAEEGVVVEIVSSDFPPMSDLAQVAMQFIDSQY